MAAIQRNSTGRSGKVKLSAWALAFGLGAASALGSLAQAESAAATAGDQPVYSGDVTPDGAAMVADLVFARPLGLAATLLGGAIFVVGLPFEAMSGDISGPARKLVGEPAEFTFTRPLGQNH